MGSQVSGGSTDLHLLAEKVLLGDVLDRARGDVLDRARGGDETDHVTGRKADHGLQPENQNERGIDPQMQEGKHLAPRGKLL